ncbi:MAG: NAD(P)/FAD-dependent oxidoreductase [Dehalococcoidia bacterium]|nr:MAG: NAD(P)/FAD-dependent oxidoreductase [Dehalococcoidia bacterium]
MKREYDIIIIGGGPNGLTAACYLSKAGQKVLLLEKRYELGGGLATEEITLPDYFHNTHAIYHLMADYAPPVKDFELASRYDIEYIHPKLEWAMPLADGNCLCIYQDLEKTCQSIARFSQKDAESYREMSHRFENLVTDFLGPATYCPPLPLLEQVIQLDESGDVGKDINELTEESPEEIIDGLFESDVVKTLMLYIACHWGLQYDTGGVSYLVPLLLNRATNYRLLKGGSHRLSNALTKFMLEYGGEILTNAQIKRIIVENGTATGVEMDNGTRYMANKAVISTIDPHQTFLNLVGEDNLEPDFAEKIREWQWEHWSLCHLHMALEEPPQFTAAANNPAVNSAFIYVLGFENSDTLKKHWDAMINDNAMVEPEGFNCCFPSVHDPYQAPPNRCSGLISQMAPYKLNGNKDTWLSMKFKEERAEKLLAVLQQYAPNMTRDKMMWWNMTTPADIENKFANMIQGSIKQGAYDSLQMGYVRPNEECADHITPIKNLYIGGAGSFSGGLVTFGPGVCTANRVAKDIGADKWWPEPDHVIAARAKGMPL